MDYLHFAPQIGYRRTFAIMRFVTDIGSCDLPILRLAMSRESS